jgi:hypothetical protein
MSREFAARVQREVEPAATRRVDGPESADLDRSRGPDSLGRTAITDARGLLLQLQRTHGNRYVQRLLQAPAAAPTPAAAPAVQPKLRLGPAGDRYEREADRLAEDLAGDADGPAAAPEREHRPVSADSRMVRAARTAPAAFPADSILDPGFQQLILAARGRGRSLPGSVRRPGHLLPPR